jgi:hypothetical protein
MITKITNAVQSLAVNIKWTIIIAMIAAGVSAAIITGIIFLYVFAAAAHVSSAIGYARAFLWKS